MGTLLPGKIQYATQNVCNSNQNGNWKVLILQRFNLNPGLKSERALLAKGISESNFIRSKVCEISVTIYSGSGLCVHV